MQTDTVTSSCHPPSSQSAFLRRPSSTKPLSMTFFIRSNRSDCEAAAEGTDSHFFVCAQCGRIPAEDPTCKIRSTHTVRTMIAVRLQGGASGLPSTRCMLYPTKALWTIHSIASVAYPLPCDRISRKSEVGARLDSIKPTWYCLLITRPNPQQRFCGPPISLFSRSTTPIGSPAEPSSAWRQITALQTAQSLSVPH